MSINILIVAYYISSLISCLLIMERLDGKLTIASLIVSLLFGWGAFPILLLFIILEWCEKKVIYRRKSKG